MGGTRLTCLPPDIADVDPCTRMSPLFLGVSLCLIGLGAAEGTFCLGKADFQ